MSSTMRAGGALLWLRAALLASVVPLAGSLAHAAAAAVVGLWLARGEHALWALVRLAGRSLARLAGPAALPVVSGPPRVVRVDHTGLPPTSLALARSLRRRGPPVSPAA